MIGACLAGRQRLRRRERTRHRDAIRRLWIIRIMIAYWKEPWTSPAHRLQPTDHQEDGVTETLEEKHSGNAKVQS